MAVDYSALAGPLISNLSETFGTGKARRDAEDQRARDAQERDISLQRGRFGPDLMAKVEAMKAAGFHPLMALGSGSFSGGSSVVSGGGGGAPPIDLRSSGGRDVVDPDIARYNRARADLAELDVEAAELRLATQAGNQGGPANTGAYTVKPAEITSTARNMPFRTAGPSGGFETRYSMMNPFTQVEQEGSLPSKDVSEPLEGMGEFWKAILGTPMGGRFVWDAMMPDSAKTRLFDFLDSVGSFFSRKGARDRVVTGNWRNRFYNRR